MRFPSVTIPAILFLSVLPAFAKLSYQVKNPDAPLFNNPGLTPPPLGLLEKGAVLALIQKGSDASKVRRADGTIGWMANKDILAMAEAGSTQHEIDELAIQGGIETISPFLLVCLNPADVGLLPFERNFAGDVVEFADREQVEIRNEEN